MKEYTKMTFQCKIEKLFSVRKFIKKANFYLDKPFEK